MQCSCNEQRATDRVQPSSIGDDEFFLMRHMHASDRILTPHPLDISIPHLHFLLSNVSFLSYASNPVIIDYLVDLLLRKIQPTCISCVEAQTVARMPAAHSTFTSQVSSSSSFHSLEPLTA